MPRKGEIKDRTGETRTMNNGLSATIVAYRGKNDIDVELENGIVLHNMRYVNFAKGAAKCPMIIENFGEYCRVTNVNTTPNTIFLVDTEDLPILDNRSWSMTDRGYIASKRNKAEKTVKLHRAVMNAEAGVSVDHMDGDTANNRKSNLRICAHSDNVKNQRIRSDNKSGYKGVSFCKATNKWRAEIGADSKRILIGHFSDPKEAAHAYNEAALRYHGEFARLNDL